VSNGTTTHGGVAVSSDHAFVSLTFSDADRALIQNYYRQHLPPGLAKREHLPPGLNKQLARRGTLPPGLSGEHLPDDLEVRLSRLPAGYVRLRIATDVLLLDSRTRLILDVVSDIGR
jgi:hypothetical protein